MGYYAQTHLQLYRQLQDASYSEQDLVLVDRAYRIAMRLFAGYYRPNNKPFLMHLVGVASILLNARQPAVVIAGGCCILRILDVEEREAASVESG